MKFWQVDAFTNEIFSGNPAAVFIFDEEPEKELMMKIALEMNLSETAFVIKGSDMKIRWFTPNSEVNLCGHATLSAAHILWTEKIVQEETIMFQSRSGILTVSKTNNGYTLDFPLQPPTEKPKYSDIISELVGYSVDYIGSNGEDCMAAIASDMDLLSFTPNPSIICELPERGFILTAQDSSKKQDYIYRAFYPKLGVLEDPVTGSANTCLAPYWAIRLGKKKLLARQASRRGGNLVVEVEEERVLITGKAITACEGNINISCEKRDLESLKAIGCFEYQE